MFYDGVALLQADLGDTTEALTTFERTHRFSWVVNDLARAVARVGGDPQPVFDGGYSKFNRRYDTRDIGHLAQTQRALGITPPKSVLDQLREAGSETYLYDDSYEYANAYARAGFPEDALDVWEKTRPLGFHWQAASLALVAVSQAENGIDPSQLVIRTAELTEALKFTDTYYATWTQAEIYASLSKAYGLFGLDPQPLVEKALEKAELIPHDNLRSNAYVELAEAQLSFGTDARATLLLATDSADKILLDGEEDEGGYGMIIQTLEWENIVHAQVKGGYFDDARQTLARFDRNFHEEEFIALKAELLAELAKAESLQAA